MCTNPILIKNRRSRFIPGVDKEYITVSCGKCLECRNSRRNELYVLAYYEHLQAVSLGGFTQFFTLTYSDTYVPKFCGRNCFDPTQVKLYLERVTSSCKRAFGKDFKFRYLLVSERDSSGIRDINPHHHVLFFVQSDCNHSKFREICKSQWPFGWSFGSWDNFGEVIRPNGIRYVTKYVCKDMFEQENDNKWLSQLDDVQHGVPYRLYVAAKKTLPFMRHSKRFGYFAIQHILEGSSLLPKKFQTPFDFIKQYGKIFVPCLKDGVPGTINIPNSLLRLLFYTPTYRYKRVTKRDVARCVRSGLPVPKHKVQSFYIPKPDFYDYYVSKLHRQVSKANDVAKSLSRSSDYSSASVALGVSIFSTALVNSSLNFDNYVDTCARIMMERDPIFERDPFDGTFSYKRAPLERTDFPELVKFLESDYNSNEFLDSLDVKSKFDILKTSTIKSNNDIEKTIKDITSVYESS